MEKKEWNSIVGEVVGGDDGGYGEGNGVAVFLFCCLAIPCW
jgi:hypothetical protein